jgi:hypothetical protein
MNKVLLIFMFLFWGIEAAYQELVKERLKSTDKSEAQLESA